MKLQIALVAIAGFIPNAIAQSGPIHHPSDASARVPAVKYESAFADYRSYREEKISPWTAANDQVGTVRGHAGIFGGGHAGHSSGDKPAHAKPVHGKSSGKADSPSGHGSGSPVPKSSSGEHKGH